PTPGSGLGYPGLPQAGGARPGAGTTPERPARRADQPVPSATPGGPAPLAVGDIPLASDQPDLPPRTRADELLATGDVPRAIARSAEEVAQNVTEVVRVFRVPLLLLILLLAYAIAQGRLGRETLPAATDVPTGGEDDDAEYLL
ncbi:MAG: hypothetical protein M3N57_07250, partial [Actinomycetota bacterium]|nr:hypothetical protein [Actinomycetota bacterium]